MSAAIAEQSSGKQGDKSKEAAKAELKQLRKQNKLNTKRMKQLQSQREDGTDDLDIPGWPLWGQPAIAAQTASDSCSTASGAAHTGSPCIRARGFFFDHPHLRHLPRILLTRRSSAHEVNATP